MGLSVCTVTNAPPERLERWLLHVLDFADEVVVTVDATSPTGTAAVARELADVCAVAELGGVANPAYDWTATRSRAEWVLMLDDDEWLAPGFAARLPELLSDRRFSHYHIPIRWVINGADGPVWLDQFPWSPNHATRMFRNVAGLARHAAGAHSSWEVCGEGAVLRREEETIYHLNLAMFDRSEREQKVKRHYRSAEPGAPSCEEYYLYEQYLETTALAPVPENVLDRPPTTRARDSASHRRAQASRRPPPLEVSRAHLEAHVAERSDDPPIWSAEYLGHDTPAVLGTNRGYTLHVLARNTSGATWRSLGTVVGRVALSYRWFGQDGSVVIPQGDVSLLPQAVAPGGDADVIAGLWTPPEPGPYVLEWDMLCERVAWFSLRGVAPLRVAIEIVDVGPRPQAPHFPPPTEVPAASNAAGGLAQVLRRVPRPLRR